MIQSFRTPETNQARSLNDLAAIPGNHLEPLKGARKGQHSIRINDQYRLCFIWRDGDAYEVEITALRLARYLGSSAEFWLGLQLEYYLRTARQTRQREIEKAVRPRSEAA